MSASSAAAKFVKYYLIFSAENGQLRRVGVSRQGVLSQDAAARFETASEVVAARTRLLSATHSAKNRTFTVQGFDGQFDFTSIEASGVKLQDSQSLTRQTSTWVPDA